MQDDQNQNPNPAPAVPDPNLDAMPPAVPTPQVGTVIAPNNVNAIPQPTRPTIPLSSTQ